MMANLLANNMYGEITCSIVIAWCQMLFSLEKKGLSDTLSTLIIILYTTYDLGLHLKNNNKISESGKTNNRFLYFSQSSSFLRCRPILMKISTDDNWTMNPYTVKGDALATTFADEELTFKYFDPDLHGPPICMFLLSYKTRAVVQDLLRANAIRCRR